MCFAYYYFTWMSLKNDDSEVCFQYHPAGKATLNLTLTRVPTKHGFETSPYLGSQSLVQYAAYKCSTCVMQCTYTEASCVQEFM